MRGTLPGVRDAVRHAIFHFAHTQSAQADATSQPASAYIRGYFLSKLMHIYSYASAHILALVRASGGDWGGGFGATTSVGSVADSD